MIFRVASVVAIALATVACVLIVTLANSAKETADRAVEQNTKRQKVCTEANPHACVALFARLQKNITDQQRRELACVVGQILQLDLPRFCRGIRPGG